MTASCLLLLLVAVCVANGAVFTPLLDGHLICHTDVFAFGDPTSASDSCVKNTVQSSVSNSGSDCEGQTTKTWTATDCNGVSASISQTFYWKEPCTTLPDYCARRAANFEPGNFGPGGEMVPTGPLATDTFGFTCNTQCSKYKPKNVEWNKVYAAIREIFRCEKRLANFVIRACFHESGNVKSKGDGANTSGFCSSEHRRIENAGHSFFDHSMGVVAAVANETGASTMDTLAVACMVAYEVTGGDQATDSVEVLRMGRCDKVSDEEASSQPADPPGVLPSPFATSDVFFDYWKNQSFTPSEAAALLATHTLVQGKTLNMHEFDLEFVQIYAQNWKKLGFTCERQSAQSSLLSLAAANGNFEITGFTSDIGRTAHLDIGIIYPPLADFPFVETRCVCYDPQFGGKAQTKTGAWPFTQNDCDLWLTCDDILKGNVANYDAYARSYCQAFPIFAKYPELFWGTLAEATNKLLNRGVFSPNSFKPSFYIDYQDIKNANRDSYSKGDSYNPYGRLCNANAKTPCSTKVFGGCNTTPTDKNIKCAQKEKMRNIFHCQTKAVINSKVLVQGKYYNAEDPEALAANASNADQNQSVSPAIVGGVIAAVACVVLIVAAAVGVHRYRTHKTNQKTAEIVTGVASESNTADQMVWERSL